MAEGNKVDLVGVGLNATDTLIPLVNYPSRGSKVEYRHARSFRADKRQPRSWLARPGASKRVMSANSAKTTPPACIEMPLPAPVLKRKLTAVPGAASPQSLILVDEGGERTVLCRRDERLLLQPGDLRREWIENARFLHVDGYETAAATLAAQWAREAGIPVIADLDEPYPQVDKLIENVDYLIVSRDFLAASWEARAWKMRYASCRCALGVD